MWLFVKRVPWLPVVVAAFVGVAVVLGLGLRAKHSPPTIRKAAHTSNTIVAAVRSANEQSAAMRERRVEAWRKYLRLARSPERLRPFVEELIGMKQKFQQVFEVIKGSRDKPRVLDLFRQFVIDDREFEADLDATVAEYDRFLFEQDRQFYEPAGISREEWKQMVHGGCQWSIRWSGYLAPVVQLAISEARTDAVRFLGAQLAGNLAGKRIKKEARDWGWDTSEEGSLRDQLSRFIIDQSASAVIEKATDATDSIVSRLSDEIALAERALLDGQGGLRWILQRTEAAHVRARRDLISTGRNRQE